MRDERDRTHTQLSGEWGVQHWVSEGGACWLRYSNTQTKFHHGKADAHPIQVLSLSFY